jgi:hypothetical protein
VIDGIRDVYDLRKAINQSVECAKAPERFGFGAVDIYTDTSATSEFKLSARDTLSIGGQLKWTLLFFSQPAQPAGKTNIICFHSLFFTLFFVSIVILYDLMLLNLCHLLHLLLLLISY